MSSIRPEPVKNLRGQVSRGPYARGTKSSRRAIFIETENGRYVLRRKNGPAFADAALKRFVGETVECDGFLTENTLLAERIEVVKSES